MKKLQHQLGSKAWLDDLLNNSPARDVRGRSRPTQRYVVQDARGRIGYAEGGNAAIAHSILVTMCHAGVVDQLKMEPFRLTMAQHGVDAVPDIIFTLHDGRVFVAETKSSRYLTTAKLEACEKVERVINAANMTYLFWTDEWPISPACWRVMRRVRRCGTSAVPVEQINAAIDAIKDGPKTIAALREQGIYTDAVLAAVWCGSLHIDLFGDMTDLTLVSTDVRTRGFQHLLRAPVRSHDWWDNLARA